MNWLICNQMLQNQDETNNMLADLLGKETLLNGTSVHGSVGYIHRLSWALTIFAPDWNYIFNAH